MCPGPASASFTSTGPTLSGFSAMLNSFIFERGRSIEPRCKEVKATKRSKVTYGVNRSVRARLCSDVDAWGNDETYRSVGIPSVPNPGIGSLGDILPLSERACA